MSALRISVNRNFRFVTSLHFSDNHAQITIPSKKCGGDHIADLADSNGGRRQLSPEWRSEFFTKGLLLPGIRINLVVCR